MQLLQIAVVSTMIHDEQQAAMAASRGRANDTRPSFAARFGDRLREFVYRAQLGPAPRTAAA